MYKLIVLQYCYYYFFSFLSFATSKQSSPISFAEVTGDDTGLIQVDSSKTIKISETEPRSDIPAHLRVSSGGVLYLTPEIHLQDTTTVEGNLYGVQHLHIGGTLILKKTGMTQCGGSNCNTNSASAKSYRFTTLTMTSGSILQSSLASSTMFNTSSDSSVSGIKVRVDRFELEHTAKFMVYGAASVLGAEMEFESSSIIDGDYDGYAKQQGPGKGGDNCQGVCLVIYLCCKYIVTVTVVFFPVKMYMY